MTMAREDYLSLPLISIHGRTGATHQRATRFDAWGQAHTEEIFRFPRVGDCYHEPMGPFFEVTSIVGGYVDVLQSSGSGPNSTQVRLYILAKQYADYFRVSRTTYGWRVVFTKRGPVVPTRTGRHL